MEIKKIKLFTIVILLITIIFLIIIPTVSNAYDTVSPEDYRPETPSTIQSDLDSIASTSTMIISILSTIMMVLIISAFFLI